MNNNLEHPIRENAQPYFFDNGGETLAILVHGFTGSPYDMKELASFLSERGFSVKAPLLAGHGRHWVELEKYTHYDWWKSVEDEVLEGSKRFKNIFLVGYSFGANLSLDLAARYPEQVKGVVALGTSVFLRKEFISRLLLPIIHFLFRRYKKTYIKKKQMPAYENTGCYVLVPTKSIYEFNYFRKHFTRKELSKVKVPTLIIHSKDDSITHPLSSQYVHDKIGSETKELLFLDDVNHNPLTSTRKDIIFGKIEEFLRKLV